MPPPRVFDPVTWVPWAVQELRHRALERDLRAKEQKCVRRLKDEGLIR